MYCICLTVRRDLDFKRPCYKWKEKFSVLKGEHVVIATLIAFPYPQVIQGGFL